MNAALLLLSLIAADRYYLELEIRDAVTRQPIEGIQAVANTGGYDDTLTGKSDAKGRIEIGNDGEGVFTVSLIDTRSTYAANFHRFKRIQVAGQTFAQRKPKVVYLELQRHE